MRLALTLLATLAAPLAAVACPTPDVMDGRGVVLTTAAGNVELHQRTRPNTIQIAVNFGGGDGSVLEMHHGIYLKRKLDLVDGIMQPDSEVRLLSDRAAENWAAPEPGKVWQNARAGGGSAASSTEKTIRIGTCRFASFDVSIRFSDDPDYIETYAYLPLFGIGLLIQTDDGGVVETFRYVSVEAY